MSKFENNKELEHHFALNKETYAKDFLPVYKQLGVQPRFLVQFPIMLPFEIPFQQGTCTSFSLGEGIICTFHFSDVITNENIHAGIVTQEPTSIQICKSRVEMTYVTDTNFTIPPDEKFLSDIFDQMVDCLNWVIVAYLISEKDRDVYQVSREMFEFGCIARMVPVRDWDNAWTGLFLTHCNVPYKKEKLSAKAHENIIQHASLIFTESNPFIISEELMLNAQRNFKNGFYKEAVINAQSSVETFLTTLYSKLLEFEGKSEDEIQELIEKTPFIGMVKKKFHSRIGGSWNPEDTSKLIGEWYKNTYMLRNRIAHGGYRPNFEETEKSLQDAVNFRGEVIKLVHSNKKKYPYLVQYLYIQDS